MAESIYTFDPSLGLAPWRVEGDGRLHVTEQGAIRLETWPKELQMQGLTCWAPVVLPESFHLSFSFRTIEGIGSNMLLTAATGAGGIDLFDCWRSGTWESYAYMGRFRGYTTSFSRGISGFSGIRKLGVISGVPREQMDPVINDGKDLATEIGRDYRIEMIKQHARLRFLIDGQIVHDWTDDGSPQAPLGKGRFGLRTFGKPKIVDFWDVRVERD